MYMFNIAGNNYIYMYTQQFYRLILAKTKRPVSIPINK